MFGSLGFNEILFIMVLALLIFGPKRLPQIGRTIGRTLGEFRRATSDLKRSMEVEMTMAEERETAAGSATGSLTGASEPRRDEPRRDEGSEGEKGTDESDDETYQVAPSSASGSEPGSKGRAAGDDSTASRDPSSSGDTRRPSENARESGESRESPHEPPREPIDGS